MWELGPLISGGSGHSCQWRRDGAKNLRQDEEAEAIEVGTWAPGAPWAPIYAGHKYWNIMKYPANGGEGYWRGTFQ